MYNELYEQKPLTFNLAKWSLTSETRATLRGKKKKKGKSLSFNLLIVPKRRVGFKREKSSYVVIQKVAKHKIQLGKWCVCMHACVHTFWTFYVQVSMKNVNPWGSCHFAIEVQGRVSNSSKFLPLGSKYMLTVPFNKGTEMDHAVCIKAWVSAIHFKKRSSTVKISTGTRFQMKATPWA